MKSILKYPGSKWGIAPWIIGFFPEHHSYLEPYFGSGAVLFNKPRSNIETVNDMDENVTNLFNWIRRDPERLAKEIYYTPYARQVYEETYRRIEKNSLYKAVNFYIRCQMGHGFRTTGERVGWKRDVQARERAYAAKDWKELPELIFQAAERLRGVQIEQRPALISGYETELYNDMLHHWYRREIINYAQSSGKRKEILWMNFNPEMEQMTIADFPEVLPEGLRKEL